MTKARPQPALLEAEVREWRVLREFPDYEISNDGRLRRLTAGSNTKAGALIRVTMSSGQSAYPKYGLTVPDGRRLTRNAHILVAAEFLEPMPADKPLVLHRDDNRMNCRSENLKWGSHPENKADAKLNERLPLGAEHPCAKKPWTRPRGERHSSSKLTEFDVLAITLDRRLHREIAAAFGVDKALVGRIRQGLVWKHITNPGYRAMLEGGTDASA